jgi:uncharacterized membrane protein SpoIIM required for sporulation
VDVDAFVAAHNADWRRLEQLVRRGRRLTGAEIDEMVELYQRAGTHLSLVRSTSPDPALVGRLSTLVARGRAAVTGAHAPLWRDVVGFFAVSFPATVYRSRWWWLATTFGSVLLAVLVGAWVAGNPEVQAAMGTPKEIRRLVEHDFANYYTEHSSSAFAFQVWINNAWVAAQSLIFGILLGLPVLYVLVLNSVNVGATGGLMFAHGKGDIFFGLILPHGLLELTAVFLACAAGLRLGWTVIDPGPRRRGQALAEEGRATVSVALGLVPVLFISGLIEGFVTGYVHITWLRIGIGAVAWLVFLAYVIVLGRRAASSGQSGDADLRPDVAPTSG